jgi:hypothetical protein
VQRWIVFALLFQNPSPIIQCAKPTGFNNSFILLGTIFIVLPLISLYHSLCNLVNNGKYLVENQYWVISFPVLGLGQGVGKEDVQIS